MRRSIPAWFILVAVLGVFASTALCATGAYLMAQQVAVDLGESGVQVAEQDIDNLIATQSTPTLAPTQVQSVEAIESEIVTTDEVSVATEDAASYATSEVRSSETATPDPIADLPEMEPGRLNILLLGIDQRVGFDTETAYRSDTMIIVSVNTISKQVGMISLPRDLWVDIPGFQQGRINTANDLGDRFEYPGGGGPALAAATVQQNFGIKIDKYVRINFNVFETVVDTLAPDGIEICITEEIHDPSYPDEGYGFLDVRFEPGCQLLNAERLLQYARTRKTDGGDFDRAMRQQQVLKAAQAKFLSVGGITNFLTNIPQLYNELSDSIVTNLTLDEILALGRLASEISSEDITSAVIDTRQVQFGKSPTGDDILYPDIGSIQRLITDTLYPQPPATLAELQSRAENEDANVVVYNNTDIPGLAGATQEWLIGKIEVDDVGNIPEPTNTVTRIIDYGNHTWTVRYLARLLELPDERIEPGRDGLIQDGVMLVVGEDIQSRLSLSEGTATP
jgi:polyisoprenyl-teichoic acid--peptidoglycan teichoic acid transferase